MKTRSKEEKNKVLDDQSFFIKIGKDLKRIGFDNLNSVEVERDRYIKLSTLSDSYVLRSSIREIIDKLPSHFIQINRKCIVNQRLIDHIDEKENGVFINNKRFRLGLAYKKKLLARLNII